MWRAMARPRPGAATAAGAGAVDLVEALEDAVAVRARNARAVVLDLDEHVLLVAPDMDDDLAAGRRELDRVVDQVGQQLAQPILVANDDGRPARLDLHAQAHALASA